MRSRKVRTKRGSKNLIINARKEGHRAVEVADPDLCGARVEVEARFSSISAVVLDGERTSTQISGAVVSAIGLSTSGASHTTSTALMPSAVERGHPGDARS